MIQGDSFEYESSEYVRSEVTTAIDRILSFYFDYKDKNDEKSLSYFGRREISTESLIHVIEDDYKQSLEYLDSLDDVSFAIVNHDNKRIFSNIINIDGKPSGTQLRSFFGNNDSTVLIVRNAQNPYYEKGTMEEYVGYVKSGKKKDNVQDAHEGIRPTSINRTPESVKPFLSNDEFKLYRMIYYRALASLMKNATTINTTVILDNNNYQFKATGQIIDFDGYLKVYKDYDSSEDKVLPNLTGITSLNSNNILKEQHFTEPSSRFNESSLIKELETLGIGRPSTYATIIHTNLEREYVKTEDKKFVPTELGIEVTDILQEGFSDIINVEYTANMEHDLDEIAEGKVKIIRKED